MHDGTAGFKQGVETGPAHAPFPVICVQEHNCTKVSHNVAERLWSQIRIRKDVRSYIRKLVVGAHATVNQTEEEKQ